MVKKYSAAIAIAVASFCLSAPFCQAFAAPAASGTPSTGAATQDPRSAEASKFVADRLHDWQERMNLKDWDIHVELVRADHLEPRTLGNVHWDTDVKKATIDVLSPLDYTLPHNAMLADMEVTIVHELVHIELASLPRSDASRRTEERAVNEIAGALLRLARR
jgi:hypothetical protein